MIDKREILEIASMLGLQPHVVEKDYVLGWVLAGIHANSELTGAWIFKGGTCLKKCYFETYRFSEDLDFTLRAEDHLDDLFLRRVLANVAEWVADESGLAVPAAEIVIDIYTNPRGRQSCQGRIGYRGPISPTSGGWPKIKLDLTADELLVLPAARCEVYHPYTDRPDAGIWINAYAYEEAFAEKVRALGERTRPRDLYDVVNLHRHGDSRPSPAVLRDVLRRKCEYKGVAVPSMDALTGSRDELESTWETMLAHQLPVLPPITSFWEALPGVLEWIAGGAEAPLHQVIAPGGAEVAIRSRALPLAIPLGARGPLEIIRFAAANQLCVELRYDGRTRLIEPYSLRRTSEGNYVLHAIRRPSGEHRSYRIDRMQGASVSSEPFTPRYLVELTSEGPLLVAASAAGAAAAPAHRPARPSPRRSRATRKASGPIYVYQCPWCKKTFERKHMNGTLRAHKNPKGHSCGGRMGVYVKRRH